MAAKKYDSTVARIAGNVAAGMWATNKHIPSVARDAMLLARAIVAEVERTEPQPIDESGHGR